MRRKKSAAQSGASPNMAPAGHNGNHAASAAPTTTTAAAAARKTPKDEKELFGSLPITSRSLRIVAAVIAMVVAAFSCWTAYRIRLFPVQTYGYIIHEFDPWFNYRAAEYMSTHGWTAFFRWFDYMSWYPLGRPVGSTTYPGLQFTAVAIHRSLAALGMPLTLNEVCVLMPAWFGALATLLLGMATYEVSESLVASAAAAFSFAIVPAHLMRSMAGEFDNECIAVPALLLTFYLWMRSLRTPSSWPIGALAGVAYGYMVAAWGGYTFVLNMVALHAGVAALVDWGRNTYSNSLLRSYALFYVVGTSLSTLVPPVGMAPFKSLELLGALVVLLFLGSLQLCEVQRKRAEVAVHSAQNLKIRLRVFGAMGGAMVLLIAVLMPMGYFGPLSARVRALFVQHTRTGNPLVDSVAEHQPASPEAFWTFLHVCSIMWGVGVLAMVCSLVPRYTYAKLFWLLNALAVYYFSLRMSRLILLSGPAACLFTGYFVGVTADGAIELTFWESAAARTRRVDLEERQEREREHRRGSNHGASREETPALVKTLAGHVDNSEMGQGPRFILCLALWGLLAAVLANFIGSDFTAHATMFSEQVSNPMIVFRARVRDPHTGKPVEVMVDDYITSYVWLREHTPRTARVLAWWDYGYQITGIGNRTSLADGNTWNHEHIATIGKMLTSPVAEAHSLVRHMADYVLIWAGQNKDDLMKSPHMARIGNSVYHDICPDDPLCRHFGFYDAEYRRPTPTMKASLLYNLHESNVVPGVQVDPVLFKEVYTSKFGLVRIFKVMNVSLESKRWIADAANRVCDPPGSWICPGQYPPAKEIQDMLAHRVDFEQLENFNRKRKDGSYQEQYLRQMKNVEPHV